MVPGSLGCGSAVLAATTMLAPSWAALRAMALPIPRLAPVINIVLPASLLKKRDFDFCGAENKMRTYPVFIMDMMSFFSAVCTEETK